MRTVALGFAFLLLAATADVRAQVRDTASVAVVVGAASRITTLDAETVRDLYLKRRSLLPDGARAVPINLPVDHAVRGLFSSLVLGRKPQELSAYWDRLYFEGIRPPIVLPSAEAVRRYVQVEDRAIGYLAPGDVDATVRVIATFGSTGEQPVRSGTR